MKEKTYVEDVDRSMYDFRNEDKDAYKVKEGLNPAIVEQISSEKHDPEWMKEFRMKSLEIFNNSTMPRSVFQHDLYFLLRHWNGCLHCFMPSSWRRKKRTDLRSCIFSACLWCYPKCSY